MGFLDFTEIPASNKPTGKQDDFEIFAAKFLECVGYKIPEGPSRGSDGGRDIIATYSNAPGKNGHDIRYLVSCKHFAHAKEGKGRAVGTDDEKSIRDRVEKKNCLGFIGFYSTIMSSQMEEDLQSLNKSKTACWYTPKEIEAAIAEGHPQLRALAYEYFPKSMSAYDRLVNSGMRIISEREEIATRVPQFDVTSIEDSMKRIFIFSPNDKASDQDKTIFEIRARDGFEAGMDAVYRGLEKGVPIHVDMNLVEYNLNSSLGKYLSEVSDKTGKLIISQTPPNATLVTDLVFVSSTGEEVRFNQLPFKLIRSGSREIEFLHTLPDSAWEVRFAMSEAEDSTNRVKTEFNLTLSPFGAPVREAAKIVKACRMVSQGAHIRLFDLDRSLTLIEVTAQPGSMQPPDPALEEITEGLSAIQEKLHVAMHLPRRDITPSEHANLMGVAEAVRTGEIIRSVESLKLSFEQVEDSLKGLDSNKPMQALWIPREEMTRIVLGTEVSLGFVVHSVKGVCFSPESLRLLSQSKEGTIPEKGVQLELVPASADGAVLSMAFLDFNPGWERQDRADSDTFTPGILYLRNIDLE